MPILFCPFCANLLILSRMETGGNRLECRTCPYEHPIDKPIYSRKNFPRKEKEDVFGGPGAWDNAQKADNIACPAPDCNGQEAAYFQVQIRSADEPMTTFLKCMECGNRWREN
ncbi:transcription factor S-II-domain-containing protein [Lasiosphaeria hispida]|uniref:DNA-directed RNA polymerase subunit n=1 Tax=Lasiosphaeria hispida TaxID=260671 RepID=A0AAJ0HUR7_9PEZI|nr:transcription factor S-II-domain-containing protein [Lasiosphaeria hispida]